MANEEANAVRFVDEMLLEARDWKECLFFAVLDHASRDSTLEILQAYDSKESRLRVVWAPESRCVVDAYIAGYRSALESGFEWILEVDAGYSHQPSDFRKFAAEVSKDVDCVFGSRFRPGGSMENAPLGRYALSRGGTLISNFLLGTRLTDMTSGYQLFRRSALQTIVERGIRSRGHFFQTEMKFYSREMSIKEVPITYRSPSKSVRVASILDAFTGLARLAVLRTKPRS